MDPLPDSDPAALAAIGAAVEARLDADPAVRRIASPRIDMFAMPAFLSPADCAAFIGLVDADAKPSTSLRASGAPLRRTSWTCRFGGDHPLVAAFDARLSGLLGIDPAHGEALQGQRYEAGQEFRLHNDYFSSGESFSADIAAEGGQRTWTAMVYLNRPGGGGQTAFPLVPVAIPPTPGVLLIWNNLAADGLANPFAHHAGTRVEDGVKYVLTKWYRERPWAPRDGLSHYRA
ncbi:2OG-Fe(II) oxygenase [Sphingomonas sp.]|uniref:prolyl hydroxylase family protein n=1 Tax=Sphingomonas sp. TaxID=28214 RepID=UPI001ECF1B0B|nr:2OG-Fe(II) oxygenase [Sphingomonas sp.]MBX3594834.1 2OG-Fe(II) oxygenase [Sphingomonas sp.]